MATVEVAPKLILPTQKSAPSKQWRKQRIVIIGQAGIGKSQLWSNGQATYFEDTEGNLGHLSVMALRAVGWEDVQTHYLALREAAEAGTYPYDTVVVDTVDKLVDLAEQDAIKRAKVKFPAAADKIKSIGDIPEGNGWSWVARMISTYLDCLDALPSATVLITHPKTTKVKEPTAEYDKETVALWGQLATKVLSWSHHNLHIQASMGTGVLRRLVRTIPEKGLEAKSHGGIIPDKTEWKTRDLATEYQALRALFTD